MALAERIGKRVANHAADEPAAAMLFGVVLQRVRRCAHVPVDIAVHDAHWTLHQG